MFTLRASRRGRLEARGRETGTSVSRKHPTLEFQKPGTPEAWSEMAMEWNRMEWNGAARNEMEWSDGTEWYGMNRNGMEWRNAHGMEWNKIVCSKFNYPDEVPHHFLEIASLGEKFTAEEF